MRRLASIAIAAAASVSAVPGFAATSASAVIGPLTVTLVDLNPDDGVAPSITYSSTIGISVIVSAYAQSTVTAGYDNPTYDGLVWDPVSLPATTSHAWARASLSGATDGLGNGAVVEATGATSDFTSRDAYGFSEFSAQAAAPVNFYAGTVFTLSAYTSVAFSASGRISAVGTGTGGSASMVGRYDADIASTYASLAVSGPAGDGSGPQDSLELLEFFATAVWDGTRFTPFSHSESRVLAGSFVNATGDDLSGQLMLNVSAYGMTMANLAPVPEPGTWALMAAGLLAVGAAARRRGR